MASLRRPRPSRRVDGTHPYLDWDGPIPFAHRGGASDAPENTMPAFEYAIGLGYRYIETDVQVTADGVLVAFHDDDLLRTCGHPGRISQLTWREVSRFRVGAGHSAEGSVAAGPDARIPLLEDLLGTWPQLRVNIDCKTDAAVPALVAALKRTAAVDRVCIGAFDDRRVARIADALDGRACIALGPRGVAALRLGRPRAARAHAAQVPVSRGRLTVTDQAFVDRAHALGVQVHVWTVDDAVEMERLLDLGVDGIMTDRPAVLRSVLEQRAAWRG